MSGRMHVAQIVAALDWDGIGGGIARFTVALCRQLNPSEFRVSLYALWGQGRPEELALQAELERAGIACHIGAAWDADRPYRSFWQAVRGLRPPAVSQPADIIHSHHEFGDLAALALRRPFSRQRLARTVHNQEWRRRPWRRWLLTGALYPLTFAAEAGVSQAIVERLNARPLARRLRRQALLLHNAISLERFEAGTASRQAARHSLGLPAQAFVLGSIGRLVEQKGYTHLLAAMAALARPAPECWLVLVGAGQLKDALQAQAAQLGIAGRVVFAGQQPDVERLLPAFDVFVSSSLWEGLPTVLLEAMAAGVPVIATDIPGTREIVQDTFNGRLVPAGDPPALAEAILHHRANPSAALNDAQQARETVKDFSIGAVAARYEALYRALRRKPDRPTVEIGSGSRPYP